MAHIPAQAEAKELAVEWHRIVGDLKQDAELVAGTTAHGPEQIRVFLRIRIDDTAIRKRHSDARDPVAIHTEEARGKPVSSAHHVTCDVHGLTAAARQLQLVILQHPVQFAKGHARSAAH